MAKGGVNAINNKILGMPGGKADLAASTTVTQPNIHSILQSSSLSI
jgi:hypothetical protein